MSDDRRVKSRVAAAAVVATLLVTACSSDTAEDAIEADDTEGAAGPNTVLLRPNWFEPDTLTIAEGETVTWRWKEKISHDIRGEGGIDKDIADSGTYEVTFPDAGEYEYRCTLHSGMNGTIIVE